MNDHQFLISNQNELYDLPKRGDLRKRLRQGQIILSLDGLSAQENYSWQKKINLFYFDCGCSMGAIVMLLCMFFYVSYLIIGFLSFNNLNWADIVIGLPVLFFSAGTGKAVGIFRARRKMRKTIEAIEKRLQTPVSEYTSAMEEYHAKIST